jgi:hypothetical protein
MITADVSPRDAWQVPIIRLAGTALGVAVGAAAAWTSLRVIRPRLVPRPGPRPLRERHRREEQDREQRRPHQRGGRGRRQQAEAAADLGDDDGEGQGGRLEQAGGEGRPGPELVPVQQRGRGPDNQDAGDEGGHQRQ